MYSEEIIKKIDHLLNEVESADWGKAELKCFIKKELKKIIGEERRGEVASDYYFHKITIKIIDNGWLVHYDVMRYNGNCGYDKAGEKEKAFIYGPDDKEIDVWNSLMLFIKENLKEGNIHID